MATFDSKKLQLAILSDESINMKLLIHEQRHPPSGTIEFEEIYEDSDDEEEEDEPHLVGLHPYGEPPFMHDLDIDAMNVSEFPEYTNLGSVVKLDAAQAYRNEELIPNVDGTHLYGKYKGVLLVAVAQDENQNILQIAFVVVEDDVGLISDPYHESIIVAIRRSNGQWKLLKAFHMYCIRHIVANFLRRFKVPNLHKLVVHMGYSRTEHEFNIHYERIQERGQIYTNWLNEIPREKWVLAFDGGHRWGHMTTNLAECINSVLKGSEAYARKNVGHLLSKNITSRLQSNEHGSRNLRVTQFDRCNEAFDVQDLSNTEEYRVHLRQNYCDCGNLQTDRYPCRHVIAACCSQNIDWRAYVNEVYTINEVCNVYKKEFGIVGNESRWCKYRGPKLCPNPALKCTLIGRLKSTCFLNAMDMRPMRCPPRCSLYRGENHSRNRCPNAAGPSS
ncbi:uncharacterized protein LOC113874849 [Abrus precatorius]|uniref:Uncharacterized protein LOC113874849 n=1 Tax=Abrus precatorius TaxID=3816 RepID=A0A8B8MNR5_ABRPR|nr:uncharacterized protein LOC113874849 [Abrus precatorius]